MTLYDLFGNALTTPQSVNPDELSFGFEGKHGIGTDTDAGGVVLMGARLYDPATGRFLQVDQVFGGSCNAYDYVCQGPLNAVDLNGLWCLFGHNPDGSCRGHRIITQAKKAVEWVLAPRHLAVLVAATGIVTVALGAALATIGFLGFDAAAATLFIAGGIIAALSVPLIIVAFWPAQPAG